jgi:hypothetical protein
MRTLPAIALAIALVGGSLHANAEPKRRFNTLQVENRDPSSPRFQFEQELASCARPMEGPNFVVGPGEVSSRRYYEKLFEDGCISETKELGWLVTATRAQDNFRWQCRLRLVNQIDPVSTWWRIKLEANSAQPVAQGAADLCRDGTLVKSAICHTTDETSFERADCLNQGADLYGTISVTLGGPPLPPPQPHPQPSPAQLANPLVPNAPG